VLSYSRGEGDMTERTTLKKKDLRAKQYFTVKIGFGDMQQSEHFSFYLDQFQPGTIYEKEL
jgi:hypothetical protein